MFISRLVLVCWLWIFVGFCILELFLFLKGDCEEDNQAPSSEMKVEDNCWQNRTIITICHHWAISLNETFQCFFSQNIFSSCHFYIFGFIGKASYEEIRKYLRTPSYTAVLYGCGWEKNSILMMLSSCNLHIVFLFLKSELY